MILQILILLTKQKKTGTLLASIMDNARSIMLVQSRYSGPTVMGGGSCGGAIKLRTRTKCATAWHNATRNTSHAVTNPEVVGALLDPNDTRPMPLTLRLLAFLMSTVSTITWLMLGMGALIISGLFLPLMRERGTDVSNTLSTPLTPVFVWLAALSLMRWYVGPWRMAERMAAAAYNENGSTTVDDIRRQSRPPLGWSESLLLFFLPIWYLGNLIESQLGFNPWIVRLFALETVLQVGTHIGLEDLPFVGRLAYFLQRHVTSPEPQEHHLRTAQTALAALVHND